MDLESRMREKYFDVTANGHTIKDCIKINDALAIAREYAEEQEAKIRGIIADAFVDLAYGDYHPDVYKKIIKRLEEEVE